jgi:predicted ATP-grasp superfamily ATP-dependent carboligase
MTEEEAEKSPPVLYIAKPEAGCQGKGIFISSNFELMKAKLDANTKKY